MKATEEYFLAMQSITLYIVSLTCVSVNEHVNCDHSTESYRARVPYVAVHHLVHCECND